MTTLTELVLEECQARDLIPLYVAVGGSRAYGLSRSDSDYDLYIIYKKSIEKYIHINTGKDSFAIKKQINNELIEINGWDIRKTSSMLLKASFNIIEILTSSKVLYFNTKYCVQQELLRIFNDNPNLYALGTSYIGIGKQYISKNLLDIKTISSCSRALLCAKYIEENNKIPPINVFELLNNSENVPIIDLLYKLFKNRKIGNKTYEGADEILNYNNYLASKEYTFSKDEISLTSLNNLIDKVLLT